MKQVLKNKILGMLTIAICLLPFQSRGQAGYPWAIEESRKTLNEVLKEYPGVSAAVAVDQEIVWSEGFGYANAETKEKVNPAHRFLYYSLSKSLFGIAIYKLETEGKLNIDKPVTDYAGSLPAHYNKVTIRHLLGHTAGVRHYNKGEWSKLSSEKCTSTDEAIQVFINDPLEFEPGTDYQYSSFGYVLLSHLLERVTEQSFDDYMRKLFGSYSITSINRPIEPSLASNQAVRYSKWNSKKAKASETTVNNSCKFGGGGFIGTASDLAMFHSKILSEEKSNSNSTLYSNLNKEGLTSYGYGIGITDNTDNVYYAHTGSGSGGSSVLIIYPKYDLVIALLGNINADALKGNIGQIGNNFKKAISN